MFFYAQYLFVKETNKETQIFPDNLKCNTTEVYPTPHPPHSPFNPAIENCFSAYLAPIVLFACILIYLYAFTFICENLHLLLFVFICQNLFLFVRIHFNL